MRNAHAKYLMLVACFALTGCLAKSCSGDRDRRDNQGGSGAEPGAGDTGVGTETGEEARADGATSTHSTEVDGAGTAIDTATGDDAASPSDDGAAITSPSEAGGRSGEAAVGTETGTSAPASEPAHEAGQEGAKSGTGGGFVAWVKTVFGGSSGSSSSSSAGGGNAGSSDGASTAVGTTTTSPTASSPASGEPAGAGDAAVTESGDAGSDTAAPTEHQADLAKDIPAADADASATKGPYKDSANHAPEFSVAPALAYDGSTPASGQALTCQFTAIDWDQGDQLHTLVQWQRGGAGAWQTLSPKALTYVVTDADAGKSLRCIAEAVDNGGLKIARASGAVSIQSLPVTAAEPAPTGDAE